MVDPPPDAGCWAGVMDVALLIGVTLGSDVDFALGGNTVLVPVAAFEVPSSPLLGLLPPFCSEAPDSFSCLLISTRRSSAGDNTSTVCGAVMVGIVD
jgi:hypothetical protein